MSLSMSLSLSLSEDFCSIRTFLSAVTEQLLLRDLWSRFDQCIFAAIVVRLLQAPLLVVQASPLKAYRINTWDIPQEVSSSYSSFKFLFRLHSIFLCLLLVKFHGVVSINYESRGPNSVMLLLHVFVWLVDLDVTFHHAIRRLRVGLIDSVKFTFLNSFASFLSWL